MADRADCSGRFYLASFQIDRPFDCDVQVPERDDSDFTLLFPQPRAKGEALSEGMMALAS
jgi:hypothetical protein